MIMSSNFTMQLNNTAPTAGNVYTNVEMVFICMAMICLSVFTVLGNILIFLAYFKNKQLQTSKNYFILSLAVADVTIGFISVNFYTVFLAYGYWPLSAAWCDFWLCCDYWCCQASILNLVVISIDRYFALSSPMSYRAKRSDRSVKIAISVIWVVSFFAWVPWIISYQYIQGGRTVPHDNCYIQFLYDSWYVTIITAMVGYYGPLLFMLVIHTRVYILLLRRKRKVTLMTIGMLINGGTSIRNQPTTSGSSDMHNKSTVYDNTNCVVPKQSDDKIMAVIYNDNANYDIKSVPFPVKKQPIEKNISDHNRARTLLVLLICVFAITCLPYHLFVLIAPFCATCIKTAWWHFGYIFAFVNSFLNPFCYALGNKKFKKTIKEIFLCRLEENNT